MSMSMDMNMDSSEEIIDTTSKHKSQTDSFADKIYLANEYTEEEFAEALKRMSNSQIAVYKKSEDEIRYQKIIGETSSSQQSEDIFDVGYF